MPMGHPNNLAAKAKGETRISGKRERPEDADGRVLQDPHDMVRAALPEPQSPAVQTSALRHSVYREADGISSRSGRDEQTSARRALASEANQGDERGTYLVLERRSVWEFGIAYRARAPRRRSPRSSQRAGKPFTRRRGTGICDFPTSSGMRNAERRDDPGDPPRTR
jgi:hypothetical protein